MAGRITADTKFRIVSMHTKGFKVKSIMETLHADGIAITRQYISRIIKRFKQKGSIADKENKGRITRLKLGHLDFIDNSYKANDELTANDLQKLLIDNFKINLSIPSIKRIRKKLGWKQTGPRYCQAIRPANCIKRLEFVKKLQAENDTFENVIFTDESSIIIDRHAGVCFRKVGEEANLKATVKHPVKVNIFHTVTH